MQELSHNFGKRTIHEVIYNLYDSPCTGLLDIWSSHYATGLKKQLHIYLFRSHQKVSVTGVWQTRTRGSVFAFPGTYKVLVYKALTTLVRAISTKHL